jgi:hypothetical protein
MASLSGEFNFLGLDNDGTPLEGGRLYTYTAGTTTHKAAYTSAAGDVAHTYTSDGVGGLYIALNARGELAAPLFLAVGPYDLTLKRADGTTVWTRRAEAPDAGAGLEADLAGTGAGQGGNMVHYHGPDDATAGSVNERLAHDIYVTDPQFGAINAGPSGADSTTALRAAVSYANALYDIVLDAVSSNYKPRLIFPPGYGFKITLADGEVGLSIRAGVEVVMQSPLWVAAPANAAVIGIDYIDARNLNFQAPRETSPIFDVRRITTSDWGAGPTPRDGDIGVRISSLYVGRPYFKHISDFCIAFDACLGYGEARIGEIRNCRKSVIRPRGTPQQFTNHTRIIGGAFAVGASVGSGLSRYGIELRGELPFGINTVYADGQSFELGASVAGAADCIAWVVDATAAAINSVRVVNQRTESSGKTFARILGTARQCEFGILDGELLGTNPTELMLDDQSTGGGANFVYRHHYPSGSAWKCFFDTGRLSSRALAITGSAQHFVNMERAANVGAAPAVQTFSAIGGATASFDTAGYMTTGSVLTGVRVRLNGARSIGIMGRRPASGATSAILLCFDAAGNQLTTSGAVRIGQSTTSPQTTAYGGFYSVTIVSDTAPQNTATHFEAVLAFSTDVAVVFIAPTTPVSGWGLYATDSRPEWFSESDHALGQFLADAAPVALTNVTYKKGMRVNRYSPAVGGATGWVLDSGGTWRALANL